jgi:F-type H+-transporting ATPase subunit delta
MNKAAKRYAKALFELAIEQQKLDEVHSDLQAINSAIQNNNELKSLLTNPTLTNQEKAKIVNRIFTGKLNALTEKFIHLLGEKGRLDLLPEIYKSFDVLYKQNKGIVQATVTTPVPLSDKLEKEIYNKVKDLTKGKEIKLEKKVDPSILGGFILQIDDLKYDASILGKLARIKSKLVEN